MKKTVLQFVLIFTIEFIFIKCHKEEKPSTNNPPNDFELTNNNFNLIYTESNQKVTIDWPNVTDPEGGNVTYKLFINDELKKENSTVSEAILPASDFSSLTATYQFKVIAFDDKGLSSEASISRQVIKNDPPKAISNLIASPTFYGAALTWDLATDPDNNEVFYTIKNGTQILASDIEGTSFVIRGFDQETKFTLDVIAVDSYGAESTPMSVEFTTLAKESITEKMITATVWGIVVDEDNNPIANAQVNIMDKQTQTNARGLFQFEALDMDADRTLLTASVANYFKGYKTLKVIDNEALYVKIELLPMEVIGTINGADGGEVTASNGLKIALPEDAFDNYNGEVQIASRYMNPTTTNFASQNPGLEAFNTQGQYGALQSYGMSAIELQNANGEALHLKPGKQATITMPVPADMVNNAPDEIPLWSFDETQNIWVEEGKATLENGVYVGKVAHFSLWNCDDFRRGRNVCFTINNQHDEPISNAFVEIILNNGMVGSGYTNAKGELCTFMPSDVTFSINVSITSSFGFGGGGTIQCNLITGQQGDGVPFGTTRVSRIIKAEGGQQLYVSVEGKVTDCNDQPLPHSLVVIRDDSDNAIIAGFSDDTGDFLLQGMHCFPVSNGSSNRIEVVAYDLANNKYSQPQEYAVVSNRIISSQPYKACKDDIPDFGNSGELYQGNLTLDSDQDIADFITGNYTGVKGTLTITGADISDLEPLATKLRTVEGTIYVHNLNVNQITGLRSLTRVTGTIQIRDNDNVTHVDLSGLNTMDGGNSSISFNRNPELKTIAFNTELTATSLGIALDTNPKLESDIVFNALTTLRSFYLTGNRDSSTRDISIHFPNVTSNSGGLRCFSTTKIKEVLFPKLVTVNGLIDIYGVNETVDFSNLETVGASISLSHNTIDTFNFPKLRSVGQNFVINTCTTNSIVAPELQQLGGALSIINTIGLQSITGFNKLEECLQFFIRGNADLQQISGFDKLLRTTAANNVFQITSNPKLTSISGFPLLEEVGQINITNNPLLNTISGFGNLTTVSAFVFRENHAMTQLNVFHTITGEVENQLQIFDCENLQQVPNFNTITSVGASLQIYDLPALTTVPSFANLETANNITITRLGTITGVAGFNSLTQTNSVQISGNENLTGISGFNSLTGQLSNFYINSNPKLSNFCGFPQALFNEGNITNNYSVGNNLSNPTQANLRDGNCGN